ncbi:MAG: hypothetical protein COA31_009140 [Flavobacteriales bacterium]|nr:hypothetical protein [Flavobacteriales bacterium]
MGCQKITYCNEGKPLDTFRKNLKVVYAKTGINEKKALNSSTFGSLLPNRHTTQTSSDYDQNNNRVYRYGFNGMEKDFEVKNVTGAHYDFGARVYNSRLGKFFSIDPKSREYAYLSPYSFAANNPIYYIDKNGESPFHIVWGLSAGAAAAFEAAIIATELTAIASLAYLSSQHIHNISIQPNAIQYPPDPAFIRRSQQYAKQMEETQKMLDLDPNDFDPDDPSQWGKFLEKVAKKYKNNKTKIVLTSVSLTALYLIEQNKALILSLADSYNKKQKEIEKAKKLDPTDEKNQEILKKLYMDTQTILDEYKKLKEVDENLYYEIELDILEQIYEENKGNYIDSPIKVKGNSNEIKTGSDETGKG